MLLTVNLPYVFHLIFSFFFFSQNKIHIETVLIGILMLDFFLVWVITMIFFITSFHHFNCNCIFYIRIRKKYNFLGTSNLLIVHPVKSVQYYEYQMFILKIYQNVSLEPEMSLWNSHGYFFPKILKWTVFFRTAESVVWFFSQIRNNKPNYYTVYSLFKVVEATLLYTILRLCF